MTQIYVSIGKDYVTIDANGHSGYASRGQDIVCASISALMSHWLFSVDKFVERDMVTEIARVVHPGKVVSCISFDNSDKSAPSIIYFLIDVTINTLSAISEQYPSNLCVEVDNQRYIPDDELDEEDEEDRYFLPWKN